MRIWESQSLAMKRIWMSLGVLTVVILVHGTYTFRANHQLAFARAVEKKIDITTVHVIIKSGTLILQGHASKRQAEYAEEIARMFIERYAKRAINAPRALRNEIETGGVVSRSFRSRFALISSLGKILS